MSSKRRCSHCKSHFRHNEGIVEGVNAWCSFDHKIQWAIEAGKKLRQREKKAERKVFNERKQRNRENDHKWQTARTQAEFNRLIRLLDRDRPCISCGRNECGHVWDCGHFKTVGAYPHLRFDPRNAFKQGSNCNRPNERRHGNAASVADGFQRGIIERYGHAHLLWLGSYHSAKHYTCPELADLRASFAEESRRLEKGLPASKNWRAITQDELARLPVAGSKAA